MLTEKQIEFCKLIVTNKNGLDAYSIAFNTTNDGTAKAASSRLLKREDIKSYISELQAENKKIVDMANDKAAQDLADGSIANAAERMQILTQIMRGELTIDEEIITMTGRQTLTVEPSFSDRKSAIAELNKMDGSYAATKTDITVKQEQPLFPDTK